MELFIPSVTLLALAGLIIIYVFPKLAPIMLATMAGVALTYGAYNHYMMFGAEYSSMTWVNSLKTMAPYIMVGTVMVFIIGYLLFMAKTGRHATMANIPSLPSATSATNPVTKAINEGMYAAANSRGNNNMRSNFSRRV